MPLFKIKLTVKEARNFQLPTKLDNYASFTIRGTGLKQIVLGSYDQYSYTYNFDSALNVEYVSKSWVRTGEVLAVKGSIPNIKQSAEKLLALSDVEVVWVD